MQRRRDMLRSLGGLAAMRALPVAAAPGTAHPAAADTLRGIAAARGITFGSEVVHAELDRDPAYAALVARECAILTPGLEAKWGASEPQDGAFRLEGLDAIATFAVAHGQRLHLHNLVWTVSLPGWLVPALEAGRGHEVLGRHIATLAGRYAGRGLVQSWDVVNEPVNPRYPSDPQGLMTTPWWHALGPRFMDEAFIRARAADPHAILMINDDDLEYDYPGQQLKRDEYLRLLEGMLARGVPVTGFGLEAHLKPEHPIAEAAYRRFLRELAGMGLALCVTELDVLDRTLPAEPATRDRIVADTARRFLDVALDETALRTVITWGLSDRHTYMNRDPETRRADGLASRCLPYDDALAPKPLRQAIATALAHAPARRDRPP